MITYENLSQIKYPLVTKYYQRQRINNRASGNNLVVVARQKNEIIGVARLAPINQLWFLTGVHVDEEMRSQGIAQNLIAMLCQQQNIIYSFPYSHLLSFYEQLGFETVELDKLPCELAQRFTAYVKQGRDIIVMIKH